MKVYIYQKCSTCRKATQWLDDHGIAYEAVPIRETPPSRPELKRMLGYYGGDLRRLFNTSGMDYRAMGLKDQLAGMSEKEAFDLLTGNGNLVKRPFALSGDKGCVGFNEKTWAGLWGGESP
jgi:arsenate reductase